MALVLSDSVNRKAREALLAQIVAALKVDERVTAAWLGESLGAGRADDLSDIDIWIAVTDDAMSSIAANPLAFIQELTAPVHAFDVPANAPPEGAYLFSILNTVISLQQVDWYWQPASAASRQPNTSVLFKRSRIPEQPARPEVDASALDEFRVNCAREALAGAFICMKQIRRNDQWAFARYIQYIAQFVANLEWTTANRQIPVHDDRVDPGLGTWVTTRPAHQRDLVLMLLDRLGRQLEALPMELQPDLESAHRSIREYVGRQVPDS